MPSPYALTQAVQPAEVAGLDIRADGEQIALGLSVRGKAAAEERFDAT